MKTNQYPRDNNVSVNDLLFGSDAEDAKKSKQFKVGDIVALASGASTGPQGPAGQNGLSAYQVAVNSGFVGTEQEWLASLQGPAGSATFGSYVATLTQSGTSDPTAVLILNQIGGTPIITRIGAGVYSLTITGAFATASKCVGFPTQQVLAGSTSANMNDFSLFRQSANVFRIITRTNAVGADNLLTDFPIEVRVYV